MYCSKQSIQFRYICCSVAGVYYKYRNMRYTTYYVWLSKSHDLKCSIIDCMEVFSKGIHRALVPVDGHTENIAGVELVESASSYRMVTQMDLLKFLKAHEHELKGLLVRPTRELGAVGDIIFGVTDKTRVIDAIRCMNGASLNAVPIVQSIEDIEQGHVELINVSHSETKKLISYNPLFNVA